ncbi:MAG TPA: ABC transporter substrate-binding protein [Burkholderiaceae bacterium]|nr:ABC transporter substrate-binding protein [Burkholderiaceae bacterium]HRZ02117.1 ABC transporter substrate-binding protein [Burkholderiaceae bacterium]HRZ59912.1 ABC transporter substrate-binding protein [Rubrivivax sp.]
MNEVLVSRRRLCSACLLLGALGFGSLSGVGAQSKPERLIVANSYLAEIVVALGAGASIVAVSGGTDHLAELAKAPRLPGFRQTSAEPMLALAPTRVLIADAFTHPQTLEQLRAAGVQVDLIEAEASPEGVVRRIRVIARILGKPTEGEALAAKFQREMAEARAFVARARTQPRALFILAGGGRPTIVAGRNTNPAAMIELAGGHNVADGFEGFKSMSQEVMVEVAPEFILTNKEGRELSDGLPVALRAPGAMATPAGKAGRLISIPNEYLQGMGILTPRGIVLLAQQLHPGLK